MSEPRLALLNKGLVFGSALAALILLAIFYSVVSSHVDRAAYRRLEAATPAATTTAPVVATSSHGAVQLSMPAANLVLIGTKR